MHDEDDGEGYQADARSRPDDRGAHAEQVEYHGKEREERRCERRYKEIRQASFRYRREVFNGAHAENRDDAAEPGDRDGYLTESDQQIRGFDLGPLPLADRAPRYATDADRPTRTEQIREADGQGAERVGDIAVAREVRLVESCQLKHYESTS